MKLIYNGRNGIVYPHFELPEQKTYPLGKYGTLRLEFLKNHRKGTYTTLLTEFRLNEYLHEIDKEAKRRVNELTRLLASGNGVTEELKAADPMRWVQEMQNAKACAEEIVLQEVIYK